MLNFTQLFLFAEACMYKYGLSRDSIVLFDVFHE